MHTLVIGLGSMGFGAACSCLDAGLRTTGFDRSESAMEAFVAAGGSTIASLTEARAVDCVLVFVVNADQAREVLLDSGLLPALNEGAVIINCVTMAPSRATELARLIEAEGIGYVDAPVSGGAARAREGRMTIMASGDPRCFERTADVLDAISAQVFRLGDRPGAGSQMKLINQLLAGVHIAATAEAMHLAAALHMDLHQVLAVISQCAGTSWMFENRGPHIANGDYSPLSSVNIFVKDIGIVTDEAAALGVSTPLAATANSLYQEASAAGFGGEDDSAVIKILARASGVALPGMDA